MDKRILEIVFTEQKEELEMRRGEPLCHRPEEKLIDLENISNKDLFNYMFNDRMCIEYDSDSSENNDICDELDENENEIEMQKADD